MFNKFIDDQRPEIQCIKSYDMVNVQGLVNDIVKRDLNPSRNKEESEMSNSGKYSIKADVVNIT